MVGRRENGLVHSSSPCEPPGRMLNCPRFRKEALHFLSKFTCYGLSKTLKSVIKAKKRDIALFRLGRHVTRPEVD